MRRSRLLLILVALAAWIIFPATSALADCPILPNPTPTPQQPYGSKILSTQPSHLLAYWKLSETSGSTAADSSGNGRNAVYSGVTLNGTTFLNGDPAPNLDGINDLINAYSSSFATAFSGGEGTALLWAKVNSAGTWADSTLRRMLYFGVDLNNRLVFQKGTAANQVSLVYIAGGTNKSATINSFSTTTWFAVAVTWSKSADQAQYYVDGAAVGTALTGLGNWTGALANTTVTIGAGSTGANEPWYGSIANVALWDVPLNPTEIAALATVDPIIPTETPAPTCTPTPTFTWTPSPTWTPTFTPTPTATANTFIFWTMPPPATGTALPDATGTPTPAPGQDVAFDYTVTAGGLAVDILLLAIFVTILIAVAVAWIRERRNAAED